eukprot:9705172-Alexandrium_andersonii.AAC.1
MVDAPCTLVRARWFLSGAFGPFGWGLACSFHPFDCRPVGDVGPPALAVLGAAALRVQRSCGRF